MSCDPSPVMSAYPNPFIFQQGSRFSSLTIACSSRPFAGKGGVGNDPVFNPSSAIYNSVLDPADWYNMTNGSGEFNLATGTPYGFFPSSLPGREIGYPVIISSYVSGSRARGELAYLLQGGLLDKSITDSMSLQLLVYNPLAVVFGMFSATFTWSDSGQVDMKFTFAGLPAVE